MSIIEANDTIVQDVHPEVVELRRRLHRHPELGLDLPRTQAAVVEFLEGLGLEVTLGEGLSSVVADLDTGRPGPTVLLRGDMDALPMPEDTGLEFASEVDGRMHACGHDAHTAMLAGAAKVLSAGRDRLPGRIRFMFQPGEEGQGGARVMIDEGVLDGVDGAFAIDVTPNLPSGTIGYRSGPALAATDEFSITFRGRGGHASTPHWATDPVPVAAEAVLALQSMITRTVDAFNPAVLTVASLRAGTTSNVIPETAELVGTIRTVNELVRLGVVERVSQVCEGVAAAHGCTAEVEMEAGYPVTVNHAGFIELVADVAATTVGQDSMIELPAPVMGAEDFSYVTARVPAAMAFLGVCMPEEPNPLEAPACHSNRMMLHEDAMATGVAMHVAVATRFLSDPPGWLPGDR
ncbi:MAG: amidohydrolase [Microthrixaceae bacterium]|nr:amidohydrolase [Microthrixaceae bacterium]